MKIKKLIVRKTKPSEEVIREIQFKEKGLNLIIDDTPESLRESGNSVGKSTAIKIIDLCLGAKSVRELYYDSDTRSENVVVKDFLEEYKVQAELILIDENKREYSIKRDLFLRGKKYIFDEPYSEQDFWDELKKIIFGLKEPRPTFRQLIPKFVRVENTAEERMIKFLPIMTGSDVYDTIYCFLFQIYSDELLSKKGEISQLFNDFRTVAAEQKREVGKQLNELKTLATERINALKSEFEDTHSESQNIDLTRTAYPIPLGSRHPLSLVRNEICDIFARLGFSIAEGPEIEDDWHVFSALNFAEDHPARDMQDTFFIQRSPDILLRTHTSSVQTRTMEHSQPPIRIICPGRVYRNEAISYRAHCFFHQVEALYIDKNVSFADLKQALLYFAKEMFGSETQIRLRPSYFPFTEPSAEMDISCNICGGKGCAFCKHTGWVEILGCGMVDPNVLEACGIDSKIYSGYALGMGIERVTNLKYKVKDLRMFSENDVRFLEEFESAH